MVQGYLSLVLHAHLPFVRHPEFEEFLEEDWFYQAVTETYIPLIHVFEGLQRDHVPFAVTMSLTPTLLSMLADPLLQERYLRHLDRSLEFAEKELHRTRHDPAFHPLAEMYHRRFAEARTTFRDRYDSNLITAFRQLADAGCLDILTCAATHGFLPFMEANPEALRAQIQVAVRTHTRLLGRSPYGIWLPECAYTPGLERYLEEAGLRFFFLDTHGVLHASPRPKYGVYAPVQCPNGVAAFARDPETSTQVWSANEGYPGDAVYRDFYRDAGFDLPYDYVRPYIASTGDRKMTGFKYYRITGDTDQKEPYQPEWARNKTAEHAANFMFNRERQVEHLRGAMGREPLIVSMYDAELFGHWWAEGPWWLDQLIRKSAYDQQVYQLTTPRQFL
ncbi:MAG: glycoside hydrolase family 57 protein, partial [Nitrospinaceae bacterium]